ncbi:hypothetical protein DV495_003339 [Geotrichum candidum]|nr:hypothetical protein DV452_003077 [Geotrichum candidum]KAF5126645.1 hypothetical protein DV495_003339 [Geotrichum candidum]KAF7499507.1 hypothetical protein DV113_002434 [Geotrichum candidum]KAI8133867.1 hypothetical protein DUD61_002444 [Geotrichum candidum]KAI9214418.1 hypothetical protein DS838_000637 [Geotrichum bryndzae]
MPFVSHGDYVEVISITEEERHAPRTPELVEKLRAYQDQAQYLKTQTEPVLFYLPHTLLPDQQIIIDDQIRDAEDLLADFDIGADLDFIGTKLVPNEPRYLIVTDDTHDGENKKFAFILFVPDNAKVRSKMLYASSSSLLQRQLGGASNFTRQIYWTEIEEVSAKGWKEHLAHEKLDAPLTREEQSLQDVREKEADQMFGTNARRSHVVAGGSIHAVSASNGNLPIQLSEEAKLALEKLTQGPGAIGLQIDSKGETLVLTEKSRTGESVDKNELVETVIDSVNPQYTVFKESSDGNAIFIYTCPTASKVKERMVYAVNRKPASNIVSNSGIKVEKELEGSSGSDIIDEIVFGAAAVPSHAAPTKARFSRPKPPGRK